MWWRGVRSVDRKVHVTISSRLTTWLLGLENITTPSDINNNIDYVIEGTQRKWKPNHVKKIMKNVEKITREATRT